MTSLEKSKRANAFQRGLVKAIPRFPNDKASLQALEAKTLTDLLITYIGWRLRYVAARPRRVTGVANLDADPRLARLKPNIDGFVKVAEAGEDLTPYLSLQPHSRGYAPAADPKTPKPDSWADKDVLLNIMGLHHFHLGLTKEAAGHISRTDEVLFASVTRDELEILGFFDHTAFEHKDDGSMTPERKKLWAAYEMREAAGLLPGQLSVGGFGGLGITLSSQPSAVVLAAQCHVRIMRQIDPQLDDPAYVRMLYPEGQVPARPKLKWHYRHLDFGLLDERAKFFGLLKRGPN